MAVPDAATIKAAIESGLTPPDFVLPLTAGMQALTNTIAQALAGGWTTWESSLALAGNVVSGSGIGVWTGDGGGGTFGGSPMAMGTTPPFPVPDLITLCAEIDSEVNTEVTAWLASYAVATMDYTGTSATPTNPGNFTATNDTVIISAAGSGDNPAGLSAAVQAKLTLAGWNLIASKTPALLTAVEAALSSLWTTWLGSGIVGDAAGGIAAAGTGTGSGTSSGGTVV